VVITALVGVTLLRAQGLQAMATFQQRVARGEMPADTMLEGAALLFGGALLLTPGFLTDAIGFLCLLPFTRQPLVRWLSKNFAMKSNIHVYSSSVNPGSGPDVIEGEYKQRTNNTEDD
jgi:UPF0716 protein FxsA